MDCLFCKIVKEEIHVDKIFEDDFVLAFNDISPQAPIHILIIPKIHIQNVNHANDELLMGKLIITAKKIAKKIDCADDGYRLVINCGDNGGQTVEHIHLHLLAGRKLTWPPG